MTDDPNAPRPDNTLPGDLTPKPGDLPEDEETEDETRDPNKPRGKSEGKGQGKKTGHGQNDDNA